MRPSEPTRLGDRPRRAAPATSWEADGFEVIWELRAPRRPDLAGLREEVAAASRVASCFLAPDNPLGRAAVSSVAVAGAVAAMRHRALPCLNSRDRNLLGLRRDLLTAALHGVSELLCVYGDQPGAGGRATDLNVATMIEEIRAYGSGPQLSGCPPFRIGAAAGLGPLPAWKHGADFLLSQMSFSTSALLRWRDALRFEGPVFAGVMVLQGTRTPAALDDLEVPADLAERVRADPAAGVGHACAQVGELMAHGGFAGVHLVALGRYREAASQLASLLSSCEPPVARRLAAGAR